MDAAEADFDAKLYKASGDLIPELQVKLPLLIWHDGNKKKRLRTHVPFTKSIELAYILDRFQEWPQLLDPVLPSTVGAIVDGFTAFMTTCPAAYNYQPIAPSHGIDPVPLPAALGHLLYAFCKVRGYKVIVRLLSNEPRYVEPMLSCIRSWDSSSTTDTGGVLSWQRKYVMLLWLSHLMLAPFELSTLSTTNDFEIDPRLQAISADLPQVARDVLSIAFESLSSPSKERESAVILLVRLALRRDMQTLNLASKLIEYSTRCLLEDSAETRTVYHDLGHLALLYSIVNLGTTSEVTPFLTKVYQIAFQLATSDADSHSTIRDSAPARKLLVKILRVCLVHAITLQDSSHGLNGDTVNAWLEDSIQHFLDRLGDKESPVRMAASKALSVIAQKLEASMAAEIVEAVLGDLSENVLLEDPTTRKLMAKTELPDDETRRFSRNLSAVDPLRWHGLMLTLGHLLFRRSPPPHQLPEIIEALLLGLEFEQRSNVGTSVGVGVRDAACFGAWALARKYSTEDLEPITSTDVAGLIVEARSRSESVLQVIATRLMMSACLDPSGNIRRGSSAALQELIGRHPDTICQGISVVQVVDYIAVARRSRAMVEVAVQASALGETYRDALLNALVGWRGARAADAESRRWAAATMRMVLVSVQLPQKLSILLSMRDEVYSLGLRNLGSAAGARHGLLLCIAAVIDAVLSSSSLHAHEMLIKLESFDLSKLTGNLEGRATADLDVAMEGICTFIESLAQLKSMVGSSFENDLATFANRMLPTIERCIVTSEKPLGLEASSRAIVAIFPLLAPSARAALVDRWLVLKNQRQVDMVCKGRMRALASLYVACAGQDLAGRILGFFDAVVKGHFAIEVRTFAMESLCILLRLSASERSQGLFDTLIIGLTDYTNDRRGDIGSLLRLQSLEAVEILCSREINEDQSVQISTVFVPHVIKLAAEKLNKVRYRAWLCLSKIWNAHHYGRDLGAAYEHPEDVCTESYYHTLLELLTLDVLREPLVVGLCSSMGGTDDINRACCSAFISVAIERKGIERRNLVQLILQTLLGYLDKAAPGEDHEILPVVDFLSFVLDQGIVTEAALQSNHVYFWNTLQKVHVPTSSMERVEAMVRLYYALEQFPQLRKKALDKLTRQLLHRYPKVRNAAADALYNLCPGNGLLQADWNSPSALNKQVVLDVRITLGVAKAAVS